MVYYSPYIITTLAILAASSAVPQIYPSRPARLYNDVLPNSLCRVKESSRHRDSPAATLIARVLLLTRPDAAVCVPAPGGLIHGNLGSVREKPRPSCPRLHFRYLERARIIVQGEHGDSR